MRLFFFFQFWAIQSPPSKRQSGSFSRFYPFPYIIVNSFRNTNNIQTLGAQKSGGLDGSITANADYTVQKLKNDNNFSKWLSAILKTLEISNISIEERDIVENDINKLINNTNDEKLAVFLKKQLMIRELC